MARLLTLRRNLQRLLKRDEVDDNFVNVAADFSGSTDPATLSGAYVVPYMRWADTGTGWLKRRNAANDGWAPEQRLLRRNVQPFGAGELPAADGGAIYVNGQGMAEWDATKGAYRVRSDVSLTAVQWWALRAAIPAGWIPGDGQTVARATYPDLAQAVLDGRVPVVSEADWLADPLKRGSYTLGDGSTTIRVPDYNGQSAGSVGALFLRGDGGKTTGIDGAIMLDSVVAHNHSLGVYGPTAGNSASFASGGGAAVATYYTSNSGGSETRPIAALGCYVIKAFGVVANPGSADAAQLASDYAALNAAVQSIDGRVKTTEGQIFGRGQSWQDVSGSRVANGTIYTNSTGKPILVSVRGIGSGSSISLSLQVDAVVMERLGWPSTFSGGTVGGSMIVPPGSTYRASIDGIVSIVWSEYR